MNFEKTLYHQEHSSIKIDILLGFEEEVLKLDGYDIGKDVEKVWGDSDYEYTITVKGKSLTKLYRLRGIPLGQKQALVNSIAEKINGNFAYTLFMDYLQKHNIAFESFTWA